MKNFENIIFEFFLIAFLLIKILSKILNFCSETFLSHSEIVYDKSQVLIDSVEMFQLLSHNISLLLELLNFNLSWTDISLKLFDFVIKDELELFKLLSFLL